MSLVNYQANNHPQQTAKRGAKDEVDDRGTDPDFIASLEARFGAFTLDVAAAPHNAKAERFYTLDDDGLGQSWATPKLWIGPTCLMCDGTGADAVSIDRPIPGTPFTDGTRDHLTGHPCRACNGHGRQAVRVPSTERIWCNPPYSDCGAWVRKAWEEWENRVHFDSNGYPTGRDLSLIAMLLPANRVEQVWWQDHVEPYRDRPGSSLRVEFLRGRMRFVRPDWTPGPKGDRPPFGCALLIWEA